MMFVTREQIQRYDEVSIVNYGIDGAVLMENAGGGAARIIMDELGPRKGRVAIVAGAGNNGGDGFVVARHLLNNGFRVRVFFIGQRDRLKGDARKNFEILVKMGGSVTDMPRDGDVENLADFLRGRTAVVDALFGTGLDREVKGPFRRAIEMINASRLPVYALDLPSGLDADTGLPLGACIKAKRTITFAFLKRGLVVHPGVDLAGMISVVDIGAPGDIIDKVGYDGELIEQDVLAEWLEPRRPDSHKGTYGHVLVVAGSRGRTGAALMASSGALRCGAGLVTIAAQDPVADIVDAAKPVEVMMDVFHPASPDSLLGLVQGKTAVAFGPGLGLSAEMERILECLVEACTVPLVIDADGLTLLARKPAMLEKAACPVILTPHPGEMVRLTGSSKDEIGTYRIPVAREYASRTKTCLILKGARTVIADQGGRVFVNRTGNPGMAAGGMGDVLTGMVASFCGQGHAPLESCCLSVFIHGRAGDLAARETGERALAASDLLRAVPAVLSELENFNHPIEEKR